MAKKARYYPEDFDQDDYAEAYEPDLDEGDILDFCGKQNARLGQALYQRGLVSQRSFDGEAIRATIQDGTSNIPVIFDLNDFTGTCTHQSHLRQRDMLCEHIAAVMYAYTREPESFLPQNVGGFIDLLNKNPRARDQLAGDPRFQEMLERIERMPPAARAAFENLPLNASPEQLASVAGANTPEEELKSLLRGLTLEQLREMAKRRDWKLSATAKEPIVEELAPLLASVPLPAELSVEEEQLLRNENTLHGLVNTPGHVELQNLWRARAGGEMRRFDRALRGLQSAGVMFPCRAQGQALHYHWSPFLSSEDAPYLPPKAKPYPAETIGRLKQPEPLMPLTTIVDAVIELAEREPLHVRRIKSDPRFAHEPFAQGWELEPQEAEQLAKRRYLENGALTITFPLFWTDDTMQKLEALSPHVAQWIAAFVFGGGFFEQESEYARVNIERVKGWRAVSEEGRWQFLWLGWLAGGGALAELRAAAEGASFVAQRAAYAQYLKPQDWLAEIASARRFVARLLTPLDPLVWYSFKSFAEYVRGLRGDFLHTSTTNEDWWLAARKTRHRFDPRNAQNWDASYRAVLAAFLDTTLRWMGVTEVAYEGKEVAAFRITGLGAALLGGGKGSVVTEPVDPNAPAIAWVDDASLRLRARPDAARALPLIRAFADSTREPLTFRVTNASIARLFERGMDVGEIAGKLAEMNAPLPGALRARMDALAANYGRAHLYEHLTVVELADDSALRELLASTSLGQFIVHQFSPRLIVVRDENVAEWVKEMVKRGHTPRIIG